METETVLVAESETVPAGGRDHARLLVLLLCVVLSAFATVPFFFMGRASSSNRKPDIQMPVTHDMHLHFEQMKSFYNGLSSGVLYPRWEEDTNRHFGAPTTSYYPPGIYYLTSLFFAMLGNWWQTLVGTYLIMMVASGAAIYIYARQKMSRVAASVAMLAYIYSPYHILDQYQRGAMAELLGFTWAPLMLLFGERLFREGGEEENGRSRRLLNIACLAAVYGAFLWCHPPTAYQFTLAFGLYTLVLTVRRRDLKGLVYVGTAMALGIALSGAYLVSAAVEEDFIRHEYVSENWPYHTTYVFVHNLPYRAPHMGFFHLIDATWLFSIAGIAVVSAVLLLNRRSGLISSALKERVLGWAIMGCFVGFMMTKASYYAGGRYIPKIDIGVFTWRMLSISALVVALLAGACAHAMSEAWKRGLKPAFAQLALALLIAAGGGIAVSALLVVRPMYLAPAFESSIEHINLAMIPRTALEDPFYLPHLAEARLLLGNGSVDVERWESQHRVLHAWLSDADKLTIRTFNFPGWTAIVDGENVPIETGEEMGQIVIDLAPGPHEIQLDYLNTPARRAGNWMTVIAGSLTLLLVAGAKILARNRA